MPSPLPIIGPQIVLINPWIHDFAAYDFWAKPLGLLQVAAALLDARARVRLVDLTDPLSPFLDPRLRPPRHAGGHGKFPGQRLPRPPVLPDIRRRFRRYGLPPTDARRALAAGPRPDAVLLTSMMTYWYPGVIEAIRLVRDLWPDVPVGLGGVYATLCPDHARRHSEADHVFPGPFDAIGPDLMAWLGLPAPAPSPVPPFPAHELLGATDSTALLTSRGCPNTCPYCGVRRLHPTYVAYPPERVEAEVRHITVDLGIADVALVDDAFLLDPARALDILGRLARLPVPVRFHGASGLACRGLTADVARAMRAAGFATVRLGLETTSDRRQRELGGKVTGEEFDAAVTHLTEAGFAPERIGVYVLGGMPGQDWDEVEASLDAVLARGLRPHLAEYSPVPGSPMFAAAQADSAFDLDREPLFHNPTLLPCAGENDRAKVRAIKQRLNAAVRARNEGPAKPS